MIELQDNQLVFTNDKGEEVVCEILFTHESKEFNKNYVFFIDPTVETEENATVNCAAYVPGENGEGELIAVESDEEWQMLEEVFNDFLESLDEETGCGCDCNNCTGCEDCDMDCDSNNKDCKNKK